MNDNFISKSIVIFFAVIILSVFVLVLKYFKIGFRILLMKLNIVNKNHERSYTELIGFGIGKLLEKQQAENKMGCQRTKNNLTMEPPKTKTGNGLYIFLIMVVIVFYVLVSGHISNSNSSNSYVKPYHTRTGKMVKGHVRKSVSTSPNAVKSQNYSKGYHSRHKYRYRNTKKE